MIKSKGMNEHNRRQRGVTERKPMENKMTIIKDTDPTTLAICENCGEPALYDSDLILCDKCDNKRV